MKACYINTRLKTFVIVMLSLCHYGSMKALAQEWDHVYVPFVEDGKTWFCSHGHLVDLQQPLVTPEDPTGIGVDCIFTIHGDTLLGEIPYKKVTCQYEEYYGDKNQHYYCAVRENSYQVFIVEQGTTDEILLCNFSNPKEILTIERHNQKFPRLPGSHPSSCPTRQYNYWLCAYNNDGEVDYTTGYGQWFEGAGYVSGNPFAIEYDDNKPTFGKPIFVISCMRDNAFVYQLQWMATPIGTRFLYGVTISDSSLQSSQIFDLHGHRLAQKPTKGVYIQDGKKVAVK